MVSWPKFNICICWTKILKGLQYYCVSSYLVWAAMKRLHTNVVNLLFLICITPLNIYSKFTLFRIVFYSSSSDEKSLQNKKHKKRVCWTKIWWPTSSKSSWKWIRYALFSDILLALGARQWDKYTDALRFSIPPSKNGILVSLKF